MTTDNHSSYSPHIGDDVTLNARVIGVTLSGNPIVKFPSGTRVLVKESDIVAIRPQVVVSTEDHRTGN